MSSLYEKKVIHHKNEIEVCVTDETWLNKGIYGYLYCLDEDGDTSTPKFTSEGALKLSEYFKEVAVILEKIEKESEELRFKTCRVCGLKVNRNLTFCWNCGIPQ